MEIKQYISPRDRDNLNKANAELEAFMAEFMSGDQPKPMVTWDDVEIKEEQRTNSVAVTTPTEQMHNLLNAYQQRLTDNVKDAELYQDINVVPFTSAKMKAVIDWLDLRFTVDPFQCSFYNDAKARSYIKSFITRQTGTRHYVVTDESQITQDGASFTIRLHDIRNAKDLNQITDLLHSQYGANHIAMKIEAIELSFDLYGGNSSAMVIKLHKAMQYPQTARLFRVYKTKGTKQDIPTSLNKLYELLEDGYNIGMGDHRSDEFCVRIYFKRTDKGGQPLPQKEHRARIEVTLQKSVFDTNQIDRHLSNMREIISWGFKQMQFTKLSRRALELEKDTYYTQVQAFGKEQTEVLSRSRHKRILSNSIETYGSFNEAKRTTVKALAKKF